MPALSVHLPSQIDIAAGSDTPWDTHLLRQPEELSSKCRTGQLCKYQIHACLSGVHPRLGTMTLPGCIMVQQHDR